MNLGPHMAGSLGEPRDRAFGFMHSVGYWLVNASARDAFGSMTAEFQLMTTKARPALAVVHSVKANSHCS